MKEVLRNKSHINHCIQPNLLNADSFIMDVDNINPDPMDELNANPAQFIDYYLAGNFDQHEIEEASNSSESS